MGKMGYLAAMKDLIQQLEETGDIQEVNEMGAVKDQQIKKMQSDPRPYSAIIADVPVEEYTAGEYADGQKDQQTRYMRDSEELGDQFGERGDITIDEYIDSQRTDIVRTGALLWSVESKPQPHQFLIFERLTCAEGNQDEVRMYEVDHQGALIRDWGSHVNLQHAKVFARIRGFDYNAKKGDK